MIKEPRAGHSTEVTVAPSPAGTLVDERPSGVSAMRPTSRDERLREMVDAHFDFIWRSLRRLGIPTNDADDGAQRVFVVASRRLSDIEDGKERAFLFGAACLVAREMRRSRARHPEGPSGEDDVADAVPDSAPNPEQLSDRKQARELLDRALDTLPLDYRTVFVLYEMEELTMAEIAVLVDAPPGTVASRLRRARELFRNAAERIRTRSALRGGTP